jgi:cytochrome b561
MPARNSSQRYGYVAQILHWVIVGLLIVQVTLGKIADNLPLGFEKLVTLARHKSFGITILGLAVIRLAWRWLNPPPPLPSMPRWQHLAANLNHWALYALLFAMPLSGWMMSSASNIPVSWFSLVQLPDRRAGQGAQGALSRPAPSVAWFLYALAGRTSPQPLSISSSTGMDY